MLCPEVTDVFCPGKEVYLNIKESNCAQEGVREGDWIEFTKHRNMPLGPPPLW